MKIFLKNWQGRWEGNRMSQGSLEKENQQDVCVFVGVDTGVGVWFILRNLFTHYEGWQVPRSAVGQLEAQDS